MDAIRRCSRCGKGFLPRTGPAADLCSDACRFWSRVDASGGLGSCWPWMGGKKPDGYGSFWLNGGNALAHRFAYEQSRGPIPLGYLVMHSCDNPPCCNPAHLSVGTNDDNMADMVAKGRAARGDRNAMRARPELVIRGDAHYSRARPECVARGERHGQAKLTEAAVREIRAAVAAGHGPTELARRFGVSRQRIRGIVKRIEWKHVP